MKNMASAVVIALVSAAALYADVPKTINFQGRLTSTAGMPVDGIIAMVVRIYDDAGAELFAETHGTVAVTKGVFSILIGSQTVGGVPSGVFTGAGRSVGVAVGGAPEMTPRQPLCAVPFAYVAETAQGFTVPQSILASSAEALMSIANNGSGNAIEGSATSGTAILGTATGSNPAIKGEGTGKGHGVLGTSSGSAAGVKGVNTGSGIGLHGQSSSNAAGVKGESTGGGSGILGISTSAAPAVKGQNTDTGEGVLGMSASEAAGVRGESSGTGPGVYGKASFAGAPGVKGDGIGTGAGVLGAGTLGSGVVGTHASTGVSAPAVKGENAGVGEGVAGIAGQGIGILGTHSSATVAAPAVKGENTGVGEGIVGIAGEGIGILGTHSSDTVAAPALKGENTGLGDGIVGTSISGAGLCGTHSSSATAAPAVAATNTGSGEGLHALSGGTSAAVRGDCTGSGPGGHFSSMEGPAIIADGYVDAVGFRHTWSRNYALSIPAAAFHPSTDQPYVCERASTNGGYIAEAGYGAMVAPVFLPGSATVTELRADFFDDGPSNFLAVELKCVDQFGPPSFMAQVTSPGGGYGTATEDDIVSPDVNNLYRSYYVVCWSTAWPGDDTARLIRVRIKYELDEID